MNIVQSVIVSARNYSKSGYSSSYLTKITWSNQKFDSFIH